MGTPNYITTNGLELLRRELDYLQRVLRPQVAEEVRVAAAQGDRSENAEYLFGKRKLRDIDSRLRHLIGRLDNVVPVDPGGQTGDKVLFGATVVVEDEDGEEPIYEDEFSHDEMCEEGEEEMEEECYADEFSHDEEDPHDSTYGVFHFIGKRLYLPPSVTMTSMRNGRF